MTIIPANLSKQKPLICVAILRNSLDLFSSTGHAHTACVEKLLRMSNRPSIGDVNRARTYSKCTYSIVRIRVCAMHVRFTHHARFRQ